MSIKKYVLRSGKKEVHPDASRSLLGIAGHHVDEVSSGPGMMGSAEGRILLEGWRLSDLE